MKSALAQLPKSCRGGLRVGSEPKKAAHLEGIPAHALERFGRGRLLLRRSLDRAGFGSLSRFLCNPAGHAGGAHCGHSPGTQRIMDEASRPEFDRCQCRPLERLPLSPAGLGKSVQRGLPDDPPCGGCRIGSTASAFPEFECFRRALCTEYQRVLSGPMVLIGESSLHRATAQFTLRYHQERNHPGLDNKIIRPEFSPWPTEGSINCR